MQLLLGRVVVVMVLILLSLLLHRATLQAAAEVVDTTITTSGGMAVQAAAVAVLIEIPMLSQAQQIRAAGAAVAVLQVGLLVGQHPEVQGS
jgi:hypothetical protein